MLKSAAKVYQHVPDLSEESDDVPVITPLAPPLRVAVQRSCGLSDHHGVQNSSPPGDALREPWHRGSAKVIRHIANGEPESTVPLQCKPVFVRKFV